MSLSDDATDRTKFIFPANTRIGPRAFRIVWCGDATDAPGLHTGFVPYVQVDKIKYANAAPWPTGADGTGWSLQRKIATDYGDEPLNWLTAEPSAGGPNTGSQPRGIRFTAVALAGPTLVRFSWLAEAGRPYRIEYTEQLDTTSWVDLKEVVPASAEASASDSIAPGGRRFYRVRLSQ